MPFFIATSEISIEDGYYDIKNDDGKMRSLKFFLLRTRYGWHLSLIFAYFYRDNV